VSFAECIDTLEALVTPAVAKGVAASLPRSPALQT